MIVFLKEEGEKFASKLAVTSSHMSYNSCCCRSRNASVSPPSLGTRTKRRTRTTTTNSTMTHRAALAKKPTNFHTTAALIAEEGSGENNNNNNRRKTVLMTGMSALLSSFAGRTTNSQAAELKGQVKDCENCSNSNTSLREGDKEFLTTNSGLRYIDLREGDLAKVPKKGDVVVVDWVGYTAGYQAKKIESTRETDAPFTFRVGSGEAIPAFDEAVLNMGKGGIKRIEIAGELEEKLGYSRNPGERYNGVGPKPTTFGGLRALDFVLDNKTLKDFNRTLLFDVKLVAIRSST
jgi:FKBP-type peptidyl-prolyl cis-trans isomerase